jgi:UTP--glucose-1-phosphate uridylyltransferase
LEEVAASGIPLAILVTGPRRDAIEDQFDAASEPDRRLTDPHKGGKRKQILGFPQLPELAYVRQAGALGVGRALLTARDFVGEEPFAVLLSDEVIEGEVACLRQMVTAFTRYG